MKGSQLAVRCERVGYNAGMVANATRQIETAKQAILPRADARAGEEKSETVSFWSDADANITVSSLSTHELLGFYDQKQSEVASVDQSNQQYSILALTDSNGNVSERYAYTAYGQPTFLNASATVQTSSAADNRYTYTAREWDSTLGLHHFRARWMSGLTGRFLSRDPIGYAGGISLNQFVSGMVFSVTDPLGLEPTMKVVTPATVLSDCGAATFKVKFEMSLLDRGWILQHVKVEAWVTDCEDNPVEAINSDSELTEGWEVANGKVYIGLMADEFKHAGDTYETVDEGNQRKGTIQITGNVKFIANYKLTIPPWNAGGSGPAGGLPTIEPTPPGWVDDGQNHSMTETFDCCCHGSKPSVSSTPR